MKNIDKLNQSRSSRMKTLPMKPMNDKSFGTITNSLEEFNLVDDLNNMVKLLNKLGFGVADLDIGFRDFPGVGPAKYGGGKWKYLSYVDARGVEAPYWFIQSTEYPEYPSLAEYSYKFIFYTDDQKNFVAIPIGSDASGLDLKYFKVDFEDFFGITYESWSSIFGDKFLFEYYQFMSKQ